MSFPSTARLDDTVPTGTRTLVCPQCNASWSDAEAPEECPEDGTKLVREGEQEVLPRVPAVHVHDRQDRDPMLGRTLEGRYTILARLGSGSMGTVYRAKQHAMGRDVAIKILRGDRAIDDTAKARFMREARANSLLASPNTVTVFDFGQSESGEFYLAMELLDGESLGQRLTRLGRLPVAVAVDTARQALRSLSEAHAKGIIHRDLKPDNLFFARVLTSASGSTAGEGHQEIVKVLDFGIAKMMRDDDEPMGVVETQAGTVFGTPRYMSPEQAQGKPLDARTDLYSLGVIIYQMLTGRPPFTDNDAVVVMARHIKSVPKRPSEVNPEACVPPELEDVVMRALSKAPEDRQASADMFASELLAALEAQGAMTSGVRASLPNLAGVRIPDSVRPPPSAGTTLRRRSVAGIPVPFAIAVMPVVALVAATGVYLGMRSGERSTAAHEPETHVPTSVARVAPEEALPVEPPVITPDALPIAPTTIASASEAKRGTRVRTVSRPSKVPPPASATATSPPAPAPAPAPTSAYGIFE